VNGDGAAAVIVSVPGRIANPDWSRDGRYLAYSDYSGGPRSDIRYLEFDNGVASEPRTYLGTAASEYSAKLFPSVGRYIAYVSNQTGRDEVYVARFPDARDVQKVSLIGGRRARWRSDGVELYYVEGTTLVAVPVSIQAQGGLSLGRPQRLFETPDLGAAGFAATADGRRFITVSPAPSVQAALPSLHVVENWYQEHRGTNR
jgi:Tol biopolymer transport system component